MEGKLAKLKERFIDENDPTMFLRKYIDDVRKTVSEIENLYRSGSANRNKIVKDCALRVQKIEQLSIDTEELLMNHLQGLEPPEDSNSTVESKIEEGSVGFVKDMLLWGKNGYTYLSGELDRSSGKVILPRGYRAFTPAIKKVRGGDPQAPVLIQIGEKIHPVERIVTPDQTDVIVHFDPTQTHSFKQLDKKTFPRINVK